MEWKEEFLGLLPVRKLVDVDIVQWGLEIEANDPFVVEESPYYHNSRMGNPVQQMAPANRTCTFMTNVSPPFHNKNEHRFMRLTLPSSASTCPSILAQCS